MKKFWILILTLTILFAAAVSAGAEFSDEPQLPDKNRTAIDYAVGKGIISGFPDKSFRPSSTLTRAQAAKILCVALEGGEKANAVAAAETGFADVPATHWASGCVAYCAEKRIVAGVGSGRFNPDGKLSSAAFAKMLLVAYGHDPEAEGLVGENWIENTDKALKASGCDEGIKQVSSGQLSRGSACQLVCNFVRRAEEKELAEMGYPFETFPLNEKQNFRVLGRSVLTDEALLCDFAASGVEFTLDCAGTLWVTLDTPAESGIRVRAFVDGKRGEALTFSPKLKTQPLFCGIAPGVHTIRILKDTQADNLENKLISFSVSAKKDTIKATEQKRRYIEFIGDSITSGCGLYGAGAEGVSTYSAGPSYGVQTADLLDADFALISRGGIGLQQKAGPGGSCTSDVLYDYQNYYRDKETKFDFARKPDVVVIALGTNDKKTETYYDQMKAFIGQVRARYQDTSLKIILMHNMMTDRYTETFEKIASEDPYCWQLKVPQDRNGHSHHPTAEGHTQYAQLLSEFIKTIL